MNNYLGNDKFLKYLSSNETKMNRIYQKSILNIFSLAALGFLKGKIKTSDLLGSRAALKPKYRSLLDAKISAELKKNGVDVGDDYIGIFGKKFFFVNLEEVISGFLPIVVHDQYDAMRFLKEDSVVIDAGANIGIFSVLAANLCPKGKIYAFEPASITFDALNKNTGQYENMLAYRNGVGDKNVTKKLFVKKWALGTNYIEDTVMEGHDPDDYPDSEEVKIITIDSFVKENNLSHVDFIKMDTEGYEPNILNGAKETIRRFSPTIAMSAYHHPSHKTELPKMVLSAHPDYKYELRTDGEEDFIFWV
jgi:FkbM family methyltransferase